MKILRARFLSAFGFHLFLGGLLVAALAGCDHQDVKVYKLAKDPSGAKPPGELPMASMIGSTPAAQPHLKWTLPAGWTEVPAGQMRVASFVVKGADGQQADVSIIPLPGGAGGDASNVNRWRGQVGLPTVSPEELSQAAMMI